MPKKVEKRMVREKKACTEAREVVSEAEEEKKITKKRLQND